MTIDFLTPVGGLIALAVLVPLGAYFQISRRAARVRRALGLPGLPPRQRLVPLSAMIVVAGLLGLAAAQPFLQRASTRRVRSDAEVLMVFDVSRSMLAQGSLETPTRLEHAKAAAERLRADLPSVPVGIASLTNRVLPHLFPSADEIVFRATLDQAIGIEQPPPGSSFLTGEQQSLKNATSFTSLAGVATQHFFSPEASQRVMVVLTDGESPAVAAASVGRSLRRAGIQTVLLQFWGAKEKVFSDGAPEPGYASDPAARSTLDRLAAATGGRAFDESDLGAAIDQIRADLGSGATRIEVDERRQPFALAPFLAVAAILPLILVLWRRDR